jgi:hypothetical protein
MRCMYTSDIQKIPRFCEAATELTTEQIVSRLVSVEFSQLDFIHETTRKDFIYNF